MWKAKAGIPSGGVWCGAEDEFEKLGDDVLSKIEILAAHKISGEKLGNNWCKLKSLRWFQTWSAGVEHIFRDNKCPELRDSSVIMTNASGAYTQIIAEYVMASVLFYDKQLHRREKSRAAAKWDKFSLPGCVSERTIGIIGIGDIGTASAKLAKGFGMRVVATRRRPELSNPFVDCMFSLDEMPAMLSECDYVCMATPYTTETHGMLTEKHFAAMKKEGEE